MPGDIVWAIDRRPVARLINLDMAMNTSSKTTCCGLAVELAAIQAKIDELKDIPAHELKVSLIFFAYFFHQWKKVGPGRLGHLPELLPPNFINFTATAIGQFSRLEAVLEDQSAGVLPWTSAASILAPFFKSCPPTQQKEGRNLKFVGLPLPPSYLILDVGGASAAYYQHNTVAFLEKLDGTP